MKNLAVILLCLTMVSAQAQEALDIWVWEGSDASGHSSTKEIQEHGMCGNNVVRLHTKTIPLNIPEFQPEEIFELSESGEVLSSWGMPVDLIVYGINGDSVIVGHGLKKQLLMIDNAGKISFHPQFEFDPENIACHSNQFGNSGYGRCWLYTDRENGDKRILTYQGPCT